jgi:hypothetical protein
MTLLQYGDDCSLLTLGPAWSGGIGEDRRAVRMSLNSFHFGGPASLSGVLVDDAFMTDVRDYDGFYEPGGCNTTQVGVMTRIGEASCHRSAFVDGPPLR